MVNYTRMQLVAQTLIEGNGRLVTLRKRSTTPNDATQPWRGEAVPGNQIELQIKVVADKSDDQDVPVTDFTRRGKVTFLAAYNSANQDLKAFSQLVDNGVLWEITDVKAVAPGPVVVVYQIICKR